jgi:hypothetical protein
MKQIKRTHIIIAVIILSLLSVGGSVWWFSATPVTNDSPTVTENATSTLPNKPAEYDPNVDANGNMVTPNDVENMRQKLLDAGLPADQWAPSDIKKVIVKSSTQGMDPIAYAKENFHGE